MKILNIAGYQFVRLDDLISLRDSLLKKCAELELKGTILLGHEGINLGLSGSQSSIQTFQSFLKDDSRFVTLTFRESVSDQIIFKRLKVKLKKEIITMKQSDMEVDQQRAPAISPTEFKTWMDEKRDITVLDTRNDFEVEAGSFQNAVNLQLKGFSEFPEKSISIARDKPIVMFCTGGIRCEKAALHLLQSGYPAVYQLEGGILNYFTEVGDAHYHGKCFVFDDRVTVDATDY